jgi:hypothetical protein
MFIVLGGIALVAGLLPLAQRLAEFKEHPFEFGLVQSLRMIEVISGVFMLYGFIWARWLLGAWLAYHVVLSMLHPPLELVVHGLLFATVVCFLFRSQASAYFRGTKVEPPQNRTTDDSHVA